ncbi:MAG: KH domain-containing protein [Patescibacteria group bacterium]|nr:KH domain-containing protein [Patescibacteria group bacterium]
MKDTLLYLLHHIVEHTDQLSVEEHNEQDKKILIIHAAQDDIGRIIGKHGRIIRALRDLIKIIAMKQNTYVDIRIAE